MRKYIFDRLSQVHHKQPGIAVGPLSVWHADVSHPAGVTHLMLLQHQWQTFSILIGQQATTELLKIRSINSSETTSAVREH